MTYQRVVLWGVLLAVLVIPALGAQAALDCAGWNTEEYFRTATVEDVTACLAAGADVAARTDDGRTPLYLAAAYNDNAAVIEALLTAGVDVTARAEDGSTPLHRAVFNNNAAVIEALLAAGSNLEARTEYGSTPLHGAATGNNLAVVEALIAAGANLAARDRWGDTPLHSATNNMDLTVIEALLTAGADVNAQNEDGRTPWDRAQNNKGSDAYWRMNDARFNEPGPGARRVPAAVPGAGTIGDSAGNTGAVASGGQCLIPNYPSPPGGVANLGFSWCPASVGIQRRSFALQAAGAQCAIATGSSSTPDQINARRQEIQAACDTLDAMQAPDIPTCQCPAGLRR